MTWMYHSGSPRRSEAWNGPLLERGLTIGLSGGIGTGRTTLSAFDAALGDAGVADFNLVRLSSVIPPGSQVVEVSGPQAVRGNHGDLLYCVYAAAYAVEPGEQAWAGVSWSLRNDDSGAGLFVEHTGVDRTDLERQLTASLEDLSANRGGAYETAGTHMTSATCTSASAPVCALVIAAYTSTGW